MARSPGSGKTTVDLAEILSVQGLSSGPSSGSSSGSSPGPSLRSLLRHATYLAQLQQVLAGALDPTLADHFQVANARQNCLVLLARSPAWATRLRMQAAEVLEILRRSGHPGFDEVEVRVAPLTPQPVTRSGKKPLSPAAAQALAQMARLRTEDED